MPQPAAVTLYRALARHARTLDRGDLLPVLRTTVWPRMLEDDVYERIQPLLEQLSAPGDAMRLLRSEFRKGQGSSAELGFGFAALSFLNKAAAVSSESTEPFELGQVVIHKVFRQVGVVLDRHERCKQDTEWILSNVGSLDSPLLKEDWYDILLDVDAGGFVRHGARRTHSALKNTPVEHPLLARSGWGFDPGSGRYDMGRPP
eukprot:TRINITY_DN15397_c0_g1_i2.p1 TRINITY_DN15397_c0_g1~~TRINITY_DN15397_c0_g1_i2.p1  ORF type:complete len:232 (+),score=62.09 TRINITY_DN15397_c0_g1_i2:88-696(+)